VERIAKSFLDKNGKFLISFPSNYNSSLMSLAVKSKGIKIICFRRIDKIKNLWAESDFGKVKNIKSNPPEAVLFLELTKNSKIGY